MIFNIHLEFLVSTLARCQSESIRNNICARRLQSVPGGIAGRAFVRRWNINAADASPNFSETAGMPYVLHPDVS